MMTMMRPLCECMSCAMIKPIGVREEVKSTQKSPKNGSCVKCTQNKERFRVLCAKWQRRKKQQQQQQKQRLHFTLSHFPKKHWTSDPKAKKTDQYFVTMTMKIPEGNWTPWTAFLSPYFGSCRECEKGTIGWVWTFSLSRRNFGSKLGSCSRFMIEREWMHNSASHDTLIDGTSLSFLQCDFTLLYFSLELQHEKIWKKLHGGL